MPLRRRAALLLAAATTLLPLSAAESAAAAPLPAGLYGAADPTYDGVWRQSYAFVALHSAGVTPAPAAVGWLTGQQCADGGFPSYRADTAKPCAAKSEDTNATGIAVQALTVLGGHQDAVAKATGWLKTVQNPDGGWSYNPGGASDPDSTAIVIGSLQAAGIHPDTVVAKGGKTVFGALRGFQFGCAAKAADRGSFGYPAGGKLSVNAKATADAVRGSTGAGFLVPAAASATITRPQRCTGGKDPYAALDPQASAEAGASWLTAQLARERPPPHRGHPRRDQAHPGLRHHRRRRRRARRRGPADAAAQAYDWLAANSAAWAHGNPAALSQLILAAHATGGDPRAAHGADLVQQLTNLGPAPARTTAGASATPSATSTHKPSSGKGGSALSTYLIIGVCLVAGIGIGLLLSARRRRQS